MLTSNKKPITQVVLLLASFITSFFLLLPNQVHSSDDVSFNYKRFFQNEQDLILKRNASISEAGVLRLNDVNNAGIPYPKGRGKALRVAPVHIWEGDRVASFVTTFSFSLQAPDTTLVADGLAFYLAPPGLPEGIVGGQLGLFNDSVCSSSYHIVAVEFDTFSNNDYDPPYQHIGVDVNCVRSRKVTRWDARYGGQVANVEIRYDASTKFLTTSLVYPSDQTSYILSHQVDLKAILPEWVTVGFSGSTFERRRETHDILNWKFASSLDDNFNIVALENKANT